MVSGSQVKSTAFQYERQAKDGEELPDGLSYPDQICYLCFRMLYAQLKQSIIDRETAIKEKKKLLEQYQQYRFLEEMGKQWVRAITETESARAKYRKNRNLENADNLLAAVEGVLCGE